MQKTSTAGSGLRNAPWLIGDFGILSITAGTSLTSMDRGKVKGGKKSRLGTPGDPEAGLREIMRILVEQLVDDWLAEEAQVPRRRGATVATAHKQVQNSTA